MRRYKVDVNAYNTAHPDSQLKVRSANVVFTFRKKQHVKLDTKHDQFSCPKCDAYERNKERRFQLYQDFMLRDWNLEKQTQLAQIEAEIAVSEAHKWINPHQRKEFTFQRQSLGFDSAILVMDFTGIGEFGALHKFQTLIISLIYRDPLNNKELIKYFDIYKDAANDFFFFREAFDLFLRLHCEPRITKLYLWSDGCAKHFKQRKSQYLMSKYAEKYSKTIEWNFYCSNHAHNICDGHAAVLKKILNNWIKETGRKMPSMEEYRNMIENAQRQDGFRSNIEAIPLGDIDDTDLVCSEMKGIRSMHHFEYLEEGEIKGCRVSEYSAVYPDNERQIWHLTGDGDPYLPSENDSEVDEEQNYDMDSDEENS